MASTGAKLSVSEAERFRVETFRLRKTLRGLGMLEEIAAAATSGLPSDAVIDHGNNQVETARALSLSRSGLLKKMKRLGI